MSKFRIFIDRVSRSNFIRRLASGLVWNIAGAIASRGSVLIASIFVTRVLGNDGYGEFGVIQSTVTMFGVLAGLGLGITATKYVAEHRDSDPVRAGQIASLTMQIAVGSGAVLCGVLFFGAPGLSTYSLNAPHLFEHLRIVSFVLFFSAINGAQTGILAGLEEFKAIAKVNFFSGIVSFFSLVILVNYYGLFGGAWALVINSVVSTFLNGFLLRERLRHRGIMINLFAPSEGLGVLWKFSMPATFSGLLVGPVNWICGALLVNQQNGYAEMGLYTIAQQWGAVILFVPQMIGQVVLPLLTNLSSSNESTRRYDRLVLINVLVNAFLAALVVVPVLLFAPLIISVYGEGFESGVDVLRVTATTGILMAINSVMGSALASKSKMWGAFLLNLIWAVTILICAKVSMSLDLGAIGLAYSSLFAYVMHTVWQFIYYKKCLVHVS